MVRLTSLFKHHAWCVIIYWIPRQIYYKWPEHWRCCKSRGCYYLWWRKNIKSRWLWNVTARLPRKFGCWGKSDASILFIVNQTLTVILHGPFIIKRKWKYTKLRRREYLAKLPEILDTENSRVITTCCHKKTFPRVCPRELLDATYRFIIL